MKVKNFFEKSNRHKSKIITGSYIENKSITIYELGLEIIENKFKKLESFNIEEQQAFLNQLTPNERYRDIFIIAL